MNTMGSSDKAMAPMTILVLKRAPSCSLLRSAQRRKTVRVRIRPKTRSAAVVKLETAYSAMASRQFFGWNGTSREPKVKTAARSSASSAAPMPRVQRCFGSSELIMEPESFPAGKHAAGTHRNEDCSRGNVPCRYERSGRGIHYTAARREGGCSRRGDGFLRRSAAERRVDDARACAAYRRQPRRPGARRHRGEWNPRFRGRCRGQRGAVGAEQAYLCGTF